MTKLMNESNNKQVRSTNNEPSNVTETKVNNVRQLTPNSRHPNPESAKKPSRQALQRHIDLIQRKRRKRMTLHKRVLIQEEFETNFVKLNTAECSDSDSDEADSLDELFYQRKFSRKHKSPKMIRLYNRIF